MDNELLFAEFGSPRRVQNKKGRQAASNPESSKPDKSGDDKNKKKMKENAPTTETEEKARDAIIGFIPVPKKLHSNAVPKEILLQSQTGKDGTEPGSDEENEKRIEENEQFIIELLSKTQPHHDHNYTTIFGKRKNTDYVWTKLHNLVEEYEVEKIDANSVLKASVKKGVTLYCTENKYHGRKPTPILFLRHRSPDENVPMVSKEEIIDDWDVQNINLEGVDVITPEMLDNTLSRGESKSKSHLQKRFSFLQCLLMCF